MGIFRRILEWFRGFFRRERTRVPPGRSKRAVIIGLNSYQLPNANLTGCVNDADDVYDLLLSRGFEAANMEVLKNERATKSAIIKALSEMVSWAQPGDELVYYHSGHGSRVRDTSGDESWDRQDECLITYDHDWNHPFVDDDLKRIFSNLPDNTYLTVIIDTCHSGTMTDLAVQHSRSVVPVVDTERYIEPPEEFAPPPKTGVRHFGVKQGTEEGQRHILISGCRDDEVSLERRIGGKTRGLLTYNLTKVIRSHPECNLQEVYNQVFERIKDSQHPQLMGMRALKERLPFGYQS